MTIADPATVSFAPARHPQGLIILRRILRHRTGALGLAIIVFFALLAILAPYIAPYDPTATNWGLVRKAPSAAHWFGTDDLGRDTLSRVIYGAQASLLAGVVSVAIAFFAGVPIGMLAGYIGGWFDVVIMRIVDAFLAIPFLIFAIALAAFLGPSLTDAMIAIGISTAPVFARLARGQTLVIKTEDYIEAAHAIGAPNWLILLRHVFNNALPPLLVQITLSIATAVVAEAALAFLGLGQQPPAASWGSMLNDARSSLAIAPWMAIYPGVAIFLTVLGFNLFGDALHDALDPRGRSRQMSDQ